MQLGIRSPIRYIGAFPTTQLLDDFNRADTGPPPSANWTTDIEATGALGLKVVSNQCASTGVGVLGNGWWNASTFGPDTDVFAPIPDDGNCALYLRLASPGVASSTDGYAGYFRTNDILVRRIDNSAETQLGATITISYSSGDSLGFRGADNQLFGYVKTGAGAWTQVIARTDNTYGDAGFVGLSLSGGGTTTKADEIYAATCQ